MHKKNKINFLETIKKYKLNTAENMKITTNEKINQYYNGAGAEWMPKFSRNILDYFLVLYRDCIAIHDWDFEHSDGSKKSFITANNRFKINMKKVRDYYYPWSNPSKYLECFQWYLKSEAAYRAVKKFGWKAWIDSFKK